MNERTRVLVQVLADTDAAWVPLRKWEAARGLGSNVYAARKAYPVCGVPWDSGATTESERKARQRLLDGLVSEGSLSITRPKRVKSLYVKLSDPTEEATRSLCNLPGLAIAMACMRAELAPHRGRVRESAIITPVQPKRSARGWYERMAVAVEEMLLPALVRGWVESGSDIHGHVFYWLIDPGRETLRAAPPTEDSEATAPEPDPEARELYYERLQATRSRFETAVPDEVRELGMIPLSASDDPPRARPRKPKRKSSTRKTRTGG